MWLVVPRLFSYVAMRVNCRLFVRSLNVCFCAAGAGFIYFWPSFVLESKLNDTRRTLSFEKPTQINDTVGMTVYIVCVSHVIFLGTSENNKVGYLKKDLETRVKEVLVNQDGQEQRPYPTRFFSRMTVAQLRAPSAEAQLWNKAPIKSKCPSLQPFVSLSLHCTLSEISSISTVALPAHTFLTSGSEINFILKIWCLCTQIKVHSLKIWFKKIECIQ